METINTIELSDEQVYPSPQVLEHILGDSYPAYGELLALYDKHGLDYAWRYYKDGKAWLCKVQKKHTTVVWMSAWQGYMQATIYVPNQDIEDIYALNLHDATKAKIRNTKNVGQSKPCIFEIRARGILDDLEIVMQYKMRPRKRVNRAKRRPANEGTETGSL